MGDAGLFVFAQDGNGIVRRREQRQSLLLNVVELRNLRTGAAVGLMKRNRALEIGPQGVLDAGAVPVKMMLPNQNESKPNSSSAHSAMVNTSS